MIYLASNYTKHPLGIERAFNLVCVEAARLMRAGHAVFSPIAHAHPIAEHGGLDPLDHEMWMVQCRAMLPRMDRLVVLMLDGWERSVGIAEEIELMEAMGKPVSFMQPGSVPQDLPQPSRPRNQDAILSHSKGSPAAPSGASATPLAENHYRASTGLLKPYFKTGE